MAFKDLTIRPKNPIEKKKQQGLSAEELERLRRKNVRLHERTLPPVSETTPSSTDSTHILHNVDTSTMHIRGGASIVERVEAEALHSLEDYPGQNLKNLRGLALMGLEDYERIDYLNEKMSEAPPHRANSALDWVLEDLPDYLHTQLRTEYTNQAAIVPPQAPEMNEASPNALLDWAFENAPDYQGYTNQAAIVPSQAPDLLQPPIQQMGDTPQQLGGVNPSPYEMYPLYQQASYPMSELSSAYPYEIQYGQEGQDLLEQPDPQGLSESHREPSEEPRKPPELQSRRGKRKRLRDPEQYDPPPPKKYEILPPEQQPGYENQVIPSEHVMPRDPPKEYKILPSHPRPSGFGVYNLSPEQVMPPPPNEYMMLPPHPQPPGFGVHDLSPWQVMPLTPLRGRPLQPKLSEQAMPQPPPQKVLDKMREEAQKQLEDQWYKKDEERKAYNERLRQRRLIKRQEQQKKGNNKEEEQK